MINNTKPRVLINSIPALARDGVMRSNTNPNINVVMEASTADSHKVLRWFSPAPMLPLYGCRTARVTAIYISGNNRVTCSGNSPIRNLIITAVDAANIALSRIITGIFILMIFWAQMPVMAPPAKAAAISTIGFRLSSIPEYTIVAPTAVPQYPIDAVPVPRP